MNETMHQDLMAYLRARLYGNPGVHGRGKLSFYAILGLVLFLLPFIVMGYVFRPLTLYGMGQHLCWLLGLSGLLCLTCWLLALVCLSVRHFYVKLFRMCELHQYDRKTLLITSVMNNGKWSTVEGMLVDGEIARFKVLSDSIQRDCVCDLIVVNVGRTTYQILLSSAKRTLDYVYQLKHLFSYQFQPL